MQRKFFDKKIISKVRHDIRQLRKNPRISEGSRNLTV